MKEKEESNMQKQRLTRTAKPERRITLKPHLSQVIRCDITPNARPEPRSFWPSEVRSALETPLTREFKNQKSAKHK